MGSCVRLVVCLHRCSKDEFMRNDVKIFVLNLCTVTSRRWRHVLHLYMQLFIEPRHLRNKLNVD